MTTISHNFSQQPDLAWHAEVIDAVQSMAAVRGIDVLIAGAFARDLHLRYGYGIAPMRKPKTSTSTSRWRYRAGRLSQNCANS